MYGLVLLLVVGSALVQDTTSSPMPDPAALLADYPNYNFLHFVKRAAERSPKNLGKRKKPKPANSGDDNYNFLIFGKRAAEGSPRILGKRAALIPNDYLSYNFLHFGKRAAERSPRILGKQAADPSF